MVSIWIWVCAEILFFREWISAVSFPVVRCSPYCNQLGNCLFCYLSVDIGDGHYQISLLSRRLCSSFPSQSAILFPLTSRCPDTHWKWYALHFPALSVCSLWLGLHGVGETLVWVLTFVVWLLGRHSTIRCLIGRVAHFLFLWGPVMWPWWCYIVLCPILCFWVLGGSRLVTLWFLTWSWLRLLELCNREASCTTSFMD